MNNVAYLPNARPSPQGMAAAAPNMQTYGQAPQQQPAPEPPFPHTLDELIAMFEDAEDATRAARKIAERCRDYYDNRQLTREEVKELEARGQPEIVRNQIKRKVNFWLGFETQTRTDPKAESEHGTHEDAASDATDMLRFQERRNQLDQKFSDCWEHMLIEGYAGLEVLGPSPKDKRVMEVKRWKWDRLFFDPASSEHDFSDACYLGGVVWMDLSKASQKWPTKKSVFDRMTMDDSGQAETYDDKPRQNAWMTKGKRTRLRIVQIYAYHGDKWFWAIFTKGGIIDSGAVAFTDEQGQSVCPMLLQALYIDRDNNRYGEVHELLWPQDEINKRASKALHLANSSQTMGEQGAVLDIDALKAQKARPDGHIELAPGAAEKFKFVEHDAKVAQNREMMQDAIADMQMRGPNASLMGTQSNAPSGRAIRANQEGGIIEGKRPRDRYNHLKERVYKALWQRVRQFVTEETMITVTDDEGSAKHVGFNRMSTMGEKLAEDAKKDGMADEEIAQRMQMLQQDPNAIMQLQQPIQVNVPAEMDLNILIEATQESVTMQQELFEMIAARPDVPLPLLIELSPLSAREKKKFRDKMEKLQAAQAQQLAEQQALATETAKAEIENKRSAAALNLAKADETQVNSQLKPIELAQQHKHAERQATQKDTEIARAGRMQ
jgi:hypothetical protein